MRTLPHDMHPRENLAMQTAIVAGASAFVGTYGGFSYLAPFLGVRSTAYFADPDGYSTRHLVMARSALDRSARHALLDVRPSDLALEPTEDDGTHGFTPSNGATEDERAGSRRQTRPTP